ncbi:NAD-dependent epimerase/dehydratase family protein [Staphylococcus saprophyticus]|uniref:NAD-dependent epimerase/dehydratase family protein n=1 Tax=Staphylococcus saprophyticus TaxID=29385 RepID=UPI0022EAF1D2|nr:NAD-dependent epimerase/dehydratase family protein [Staphylococcus saprophyticus]MDW4280817.1 NAD-dependent epimerase/dehydratase family protein [Staphylococcus saprophyticus]MDW4295446.1 NAD-dependent epimerase/dehydratase family protein [Staphylococcus saprophyticus]MDW4374546.1 NAD-dependent epimerase/dehydratase family protein [Staphylococcus saprophyticus]MDW4409207.1 NAD-dependent epimerase/dehydratase family protein [Staphylococcus saprophyticus]MDW4414053.1 NAD-dependent epimerase/d
MKKILLTGASGYIGSHLMNKLKDNYEIIAISRNIENKSNEHNVTWKAADLFDLNEITEVMEDIDIAIYLVHSMMPSAKLTQASFEDMDALLADNFAKAASYNKVQHIVFMSGLIPNTSELSPHLRSRLECEQILGSYGVPVSTLRAGLIIGSKGSSYPILKKLVDRLPGLLLPKWAYNTTLPVAIDDVIDGLYKIVERNPNENESIDIGGPSHMTYKDLFKQTAEVLDKRLPTIDLPIIPIWLSKYWVKLISGVPKEMVYPLMDSLIHDMIRNDENIVKDISIGKIDYKESVRNALEEETKTQKKGKSSRKGDIKDVRAISRVVLPKDVNMIQLAESYANFLNRITLNVVNSDFNEDNFTISVPCLNKDLLLLSKDFKASNNERILYRIVGGDFALDSDGGNARLEFRRLPNSDACIIALQEYEPTLPWWVYKYTQAKVHKSVMNLFKFKNNSQKTNKGEYFNMKKFILPIVITGAIVLKVYGLKKYLARKNNMSNAEL